MAILVSPGVDVRIIDESFYGGSGPGTVPLVVIATSSNKASPSGSGIAPYTVPAQAGKLFLATSQRELIQNFGSPAFKNVQGTSVHGHELNEYGLLAAYDFLGISNRCYVVRANIDLSALESSTSAPVGAPANGTHWLDLSQTLFGVFQSNGNPSAGRAWASQPTLYATDANVTQSNGMDVPTPSFGTDGQFAVVVTMSDNQIFEKISGQWLQVGSAAWQAARPTTIIGRSNPGNIATASTMVINNVTVSFDQIPNGSGGYTAGSGSLAETVTAINGALIPNILASISSAGALVIQNTIGGNISLANGIGTPLTTYGMNAGLSNGVGVYRTNDAQYPADSVAGSVWVKGTSPNGGASWSVKVYSSSTGSFVKVSAPFYPFNPALNDGNVSKDQAASSAFVNPVSGAVYVGYDTVSGQQQLRRFNGVIWTNLMYEAGTVAPTTDPVEGTYWYNSNLRADIMYGNGNQWQGYSRKFPDTDPSGVIISGSAPIQQSDGTQLVDNDLWIDSSDLENYPMLYRYDSGMLRWNLIDKTDQTSPFGIVFADARQNSGTNYTNNSGAGSYSYNSEQTSDLVKSNFVDPDAPDPRTHPDGMLLFNTRFSNYNVKEWMPNYLKAGGYDANTDYSIYTYRIGGSTAVFPPVSDAGRWVTASGNSIDGSPLMGRKAQRAMVVRALEAELDTNDDIRSELVFFNLIAAPGYPELLTGMVKLNTDQKDVSFVVGDAPIRLSPAATDVSAWAGNTKNVATTGEDGLNESSEYAGIYYPWGLGKDLSGNEVMIPPSSIALCTLAYNDQVAYPWYAPAGFRRGLVSNATSVGYLTAEGEFKPVILNSGQRDVLYLNKINPIAYIPGRGLVIYGQKTLNPVSSALDRINVSRLVNYLKYNLDNLVKPFLFEQNDTQSRNAAQATVSGFLNGLIGLRALADYAVICDTSNNTSSRIDANELWIDIAVKPLHAIEFIYIPVRILNTGATLPTSQSATIAL